MRIDSYDDISSIHREIPGYNFCIRVEFAKPFLSTLMKEQYEDYARRHTHINSDDIMYDWRNNLELWLRYN